MCVWHIENKTKKNEQMIDSKAQRDRERDRERAQQVIENR